MFVMLTVSLVTGTPFGDQLIGANQLPPRVLVQVLTAAFAVHAKANRATKIIFIVSR